MQPPLQSADRKSFRPPFLVLGLSSSDNSFLSREKADFFTLDDFDELVESEDTVLVNTTE